MKGSMDLARTLRHQHKTWEEELDEEEVGPSSKWKLNPYTNLKTRGAMRSWRCRKLLDCPTKFRRTNCSWEANRTIARWNSSNRCCSTSCRDGKTSAVRENDFGYITQWREARKLRACMSRNYLLVCEGCWARGHQFLRQVRCVHFHQHDSPR